MNRLELDRVFYVRKAFVFNPFLLFSADPFAGNVRCDVDINDCIHGFFAFFVVQLVDCFLKKLTVRVKTDICHVPVLFCAENVAHASDFNVTQSHLIPSAER